MIKKEKVEKLIAEVSLRDLKVININNRSSGIIVYNPPTITNPDPTVTFMTVGSPTIMYTRFTGVHLSKKICLIYDIDQAKECIYKGEVFPCEEIPSPLEVEYEDERYISYLSMIDFLRSHLRDHSICVSGCYEKGILIRSRRRSYVLRVCDDVLAVLWGTQVILRPSVIFRILRRAQGVYRTQYGTRPVDLYLRRSTKKRIILEVPNSFWRNTPEGVRIVL